MLNKFRKYKIEFVANIEDVFIHITIYKKLMLEEVSEISLFQLGNYSEVKLLSDCIYINSNLLGTTVIQNNFRHKYKIRRLIKENIIAEDYITSLNERELYKSIMENEEFEIVNGDISFVFNTLKKKYSDSNCFELSNITYKITEL
ncbi:hypothetical protein [Clostridioides difficile]|uniref:hypothetical protein n=1 Tax=Clostridioides difficile TaxID=1496 RepID=UPI0021C7E65B|nr:hypothetical protein [Clostridioides difficile]UUV16703.1 hypothetical protein NQ183_20475 [Clostridioides difficile]